ncbi:MAG: kinase/pyrophosphorylase [Coriobacteriia bacterium]|nr:kinase/pyrophosphorylase [Coriobacteriia bacterium]
MREESTVVYILSDSLGETAAAVAKAALAQFEPGTFRTERLPKVSSVAQLEDMVRAACTERCVFFYTLADPALHAEMDRIVMDTGARCVDVLGPAVRVLSEAAGTPPRGVVAALRRTDRGYFERIEALEFAVAHDDGRNPQDLDKADVVLLGVSRTSKTPLSMYLAFKGYKVANVPLAPGVEPPKELHEIDPSRLFGLVQDAELLAHVRARRLTELGTYARNYAEVEAVEREMEAARVLMRRLGAVVVRTDNKAVEETAQEIIRYLGTQSL